MSYIISRLKADVYCENIQKNSIISTPASVLAAPPSRLPGRAESLCENSQ